MELNGHMGRNTNVLLNIIEVQTTTISILTFKRKRNRRGKAKMRG